MSRCPLRISPKPGTQAGGKAFTRGLWLTTEPGAPGTKLKQGSDMATQQELVPGSRLTVRFLVQAMLQLAARSGRTRSSSSAGALPASSSAVQQSADAATKQALAVAMNSLKGQGRDPATRRTGAASSGCVPPGAVYLPRPVCSQ